MRITVLGCAAAFPRPGSACSGFLLQDGGTNVVVDLGNGALSRLLGVISHRDVDALVLSHRHPDHIADVIPLMYGRGYDPEFGGRPLPVYAAPGVSDALLGLLGGSSRELFGEVFGFTPFEGPFEAGNLRFEPFRTVHPVETYGFRIVTGSGVFVYTADTAWFTELPDACRGADVLVSEANFLSSDDGAPDVHLWAEEAGTLGHRAGVGRLVLTHVWGTHEPQEAVAEAAQRFDGPLEAAADGASYEV